MAEETPIEGSGNPKFPRANQGAEGGGSQQSNPSPTDAGAGDSGAREGRESAANQEQGDSEDSEETEGEDGAYNKEDGNEGGAETEERDRSQEIKQTKRSPVLRLEDVARALRITNGDRKAAALILGVADITLKTRIKENAQLKAIWGNVKGRIDGPEVPSETEAMNRKLDIVPGISPDGVELAQMVSESDNELLRKGLKKLGVSDKMIARLKTLDGLAQSSGHFLSISLEKTHRLYFLQLIHLNEVADELRGRLLAKSGDAGFIATDEARAFFNRNYVEFVREAGNGYKLMMEGASNMVRMLQAAKGDEDAPGATGKPKWARIKKVEQPKSNAQD